MKAVADQLEEAGAGSDYRPLSRAGDDGSSNWIAIDFFDVVVHVFDQEARMYYDLDGLWGDAKPVEWRENVAAAVPSPAEQQ
jgi:ribosome-associated protein